MNDGNTNLENKNSSISELYEDLDRIENQITSYFTESSIRTGRDKIFASVLAHFYLRKDLTQKELQNLTGYSAGAISKALNQCIEMNFIVEEKEWRKPFKYKMDSILEPFIKNFRDVIKLYSEQKEEFQIIQNWISNIPRDQILEGSRKIYDSMVGYLENFFTFLDVYEKINEFLNQMND